VGFESAVDAEGQRLIWLDRGVVDRLGAGEGRRYSARDPIAIPAPGNGPHINQFKECMINIGSRLCLLVAGVTLAAGVAFAQAPNPTPTPAAPLDSTTPGANPTPPAQNLSEKLNRSNGVIHPKEVDPAIEKPAPNARDPNVVPPPGTSGGAPAPQAK
jgi:hypothetical protein